MSTAISPKGPRPNKNKTGIGPKLDMFAKTKTIKYLLCLALFLLCLGIGTGDAVANNVNPNTLPTPTPPVTETAEKGNMETFYDGVIGTFCWACPVFSQFYQAAIALGISFSVTISDSLTKLLAVVFGVWLLWNVSMIFLPFGGANPGEIFNKITSKLVLFVFLLAFLGNYGLVWQWLISPIFNTGIGMSNAMLTSTNNILGMAGTGSSFSGVDPAKADSWFYLNTSNPTQCYPSSRLTFTTLDTLAGSSIGQRAGMNTAPQGEAPAVEDMKNGAKALVCNIFNVQKVFGVGAAMAFMTILYAGGDYPTSDASWYDVAAHLSNAVSYIVKLIVGLIVGLVLGVVYLLAILLYPLYLIDAIFKFGVIAVISPILVASYFLPMTRSWAIKGIQGLVGVAASLLFLSVIVGLSLSMMATTIIEVNSIANEGATASTVAAASAAIFSKLSFGLAGIVLSREFWIMFLGFLVAGVLAIFLMKKANPLASEFTGAALGSDVMGAFVKSGEQLAKLGVTLAAAAATSGAAAGAPLAVGSATGPERNSLDGMAGGTGPGPAGAVAGGSPPGSGGGGGIISGFIPQQPMLGGSGNGPALPPGPSSDPTPGSGGPQGGNPSQLPSGSGAYRPALPPGRSAGPQVVAEFDPRSGALTMADSSSGAGGAPTVPPASTVSDAAQPTQAASRAADTSSQPPSAGAVASSEPASGRWASAYKAGQRAGDSFNQLSYSLGLTETPTGLSGSYGSTSFTGPNSSAASTNFDSNIDEAEAARLRRQNEEFIKSLEKTFNDQNKPPKKS